MNDLQDLSGETEESVAAETPAETPENSEASEKEPEVKKENEEGEEEESSEPKKPLKGFKKRIDREIKKTTAERERAEKAERELNELRAKLSGNSPSNANESSEKEPNPDDYASASDYYKAVARFEFNQLEKAKETKAKQQTEAAIVAAYDKSAEAARDKYEDYDDVLEECDVAIPDELKFLILESEEKAELSYHLAKNQEELQRICDLRPAAAARALKAFAAQLKAPQESKPITKAPPPIKPVGSKSAAPRGFSSSMSIEDYEKWLETQ